MGRALPERPPPRPDGPLIARYSSRNVSPCGTIAQEEHMSSLKRGAASAGLADVRRPGGSAASRPSSIASSSAAVTSLRPSRVLIEDSSVAARPSTNPSVNSNRPIPSHQTFRINESRNSSSVNSSRRLFIIDALNLGPLVHFICFHRIRAMRGSMLIEKSLKLSVVIRLIQITSSAS